MRSSVKPYEKLYQLAEKRGVFHMSDAKAAGIHPEQVRRLFQQGILERVARGTYRLTNAEISENQTIAEACTRVPRGVVCLLSALQFHELTTQAPFEVWMAINPDTHIPRVKSLSIRFVRFSGDALTEGVEVLQTSSGTIRVYSIAKTIADCFKYRNKIGLDVALEALRDAWSSDRLNMDELWHFAKICRVSNVMRPYLEGL